MTRFYRMLAMIAGTFVCSVGVAHAEFGDVLWTLQPAGFGREPLVGAEFGGQVAVSGDLAVVGAPEDSTSDIEAGSVWVFDITTGEALHILDPPTLGPETGFPEALAIEGELAVVTSDSLNNDAGEAYLFNARTGEYLGSMLGTGVQQGYEFGQSAGISGNTIVVTAEDADGGIGAGWLFDATTRQELRKLTPGVTTEGEFGDTTTIAGSHVLMGAGSATVYLFDANSGELRTTLSIPGGGGLGSALQASGNRAIAGAPEVSGDRGAAYLIDLASGTLGLELLGRDLQDGDEFGDVVAIDDYTVLVTAASANDSAGVVYVFDAVSGLQVAKLESPNPRSDEAFGSGLGISNGRAVIGAENGSADGEISGVAYVFNVSFADLADVNDDGQVTGDDMDAVSAAIRSGSTDAMFDLNHDESVDENDRILWVRALNHTWFGDANLDGEFNSSDMVAVFQVGEYEDAVPGNSGWSEGDWDGDSDFTSSDLVVAFQEGGYETGSRTAVAAVPEPTSMALTLLGCLLALAGLRRSR